MGEEQHDGENMIEGREGGTHAQGRTGGGSGKGKEEEGLPKKKTWLCGRRESNEIRGQPKLWDWEDIWDSLPRRRENKL